MVNRGYIFLKGDFLYFANDGLAFDKSGVIAISRPNLSSKSVNNEDKPRDLFPKLNGKNWIKKLHNHSIETYCKDENLLISDRRAERGATKDYQGRWLFEILQNIDDAIGPRDFKKYIGTKGLGFLSVLEIGHSPEFFSGNFNFKFSKKQTTQVLLKETRFKDKSLAINPPEFQVIHFSNEDNEVNWFKKKNFTTVIKLSIYKDKKKQIIEDLENLDKNFLLFSRNLKKLTIKIDRQYEYEISKEIKNLLVKKDSFKDEISINLKDTINKKNYVEKWILWGREWQSNNENSKFSEENCYSSCKIKSHKLIDSYIKKKLFISIGICYNHESLFSPKSHLIPMLIKKLTSSSKILKFYNVNEYRNFSHVYDFLPFFQKILKLNKPSNFILANNKNYRIKDLIKLISNHLKIKKQLKFYLKSSKSSRKAKNLKIINNLDYKPMFNTKKLIIRMCSYYKKGYFN